MFFLLFSFKYNIKIKIYYINMINFSICVPPDKKDNEIISILLMIDFFHDCYTCTISGSEKLKQCIKLFPYKFKGKVDVVVEPINNKYSFIELIKRKLNIIKYAINKYNNTTHISSDIFFTNAYYIPDNIDSIGFIKRKVCCRENKLYEQFNFNILYLADTKYIDFIFSIFNENISNFMDDFSDKEEKEEEKEEKCINIWKKITLNLIDEFGITDFFPYYFCVTTDDFFGLDESLELDNIDADFKYKQQNEEGSQQYPIISTIIKKNTQHPVIKELNTNLFKKLLLYKIEYMSFINLKYSSKNIEFIIPKKDGIGIWDRKNDKPGLYELIDLIVESYPLFFSKTELNVDYFSINNFIISDKPGVKWLNSTIKKYYKFFICNHDDTLINYIDELPMENEFLSYYSDHPKIIENMIDSEDYKEKTVDIVKINNNTLELYKMHIDGESRLKEVIDIANLNFKDKYEIIAKSRYIIYDKHDIHLLSNCLALGVVPLLKDSNTLLDLEHEVHYIYENKLYNIEYLNNYDKISTNCKEYFQNNIKVSSFIKKILNHIFVR